MEYCSLMLRFAN